MKINEVGRLSALVAAMAMSVLPNNTFGQGGMVSMNAYNVLGPYTANSQFALGTAYALLASPTTYGIPNGSSINTSNVFVSNGAGFALYTAMAITSSIPFELSQVQFSSTSPMFSFSGTLGQFGFNTYNLFGLGIEPNGTIITNLSTSTLVDAAYVIGPNYSINIAGQTWAQAVATWTAAGAFTVTDKISSGSYSASTWITFNPCAAAPEPSSMVLSLLCGASLLFAYRQRKKHR